jgi:trehalose 6-phosphate synthase/phosphatase
MRQVHELVGQICGKHSKLETGTPVIYLDQSMSHNDLVALYHVADVALITSLRDGMNLVSYEYVASHKGKSPPGVLVLSEYAGAAQSLGAGSIRVNPWNLEDTAAAIHEALNMGDQERRALHKYAFDYVAGHTAQRWAETFLQSLQEASSDCMELTAEVPPLLPFEELLADWSESSRRLIIIDLLECLVPPKRRHPMTRKRGTQAFTLPPDLRKCLETMAKTCDTTVIITADKPRQALETVVGDLPVILAPEGCCVCRDSKGEWRSLVDESSAESGRDISEWMEGVKAVFDYFIERTPGSYIEEQNFSIRWYWEDTQTDFGSAQAREVLIHLWAGPLVNSQAEVVVGDRSISVRPHGCSRSDCLEKLLQEEMGEEMLKMVDFVLCFAVVSHRDEDVYESLINTLGYSAPLDISLPALPEARELERLEHPTETPSPQSAKSTIQIDTGELRDLALPDGVGETEEDLVGDAGDLVIRTPRGPVPEPAPGEQPPPYDWVPTATQLMLAHEQCSDKGVEPSNIGEESEPASTPNGGEWPSCCACYTLSVGMRKTKAQYMLPHPYHVQNLIRAMASRL